MDGWPVQELSEEGLSDDGIRERRAFGEKGLGLSGGYSCTQPATPREEEEVDERGRPTNNALHRLPISLAKSTCFPDLIASGPFITLSQAEIFAGDPNDNEPVGVGRRQRAHNIILGISHQQGGKWRASRASQRDKIR